MTLQHQLRYWLLLLPFSTSFMAVVGAESQIEGSQIDMSHFGVEANADSFEYKICNDFPQQMLHHAASLALAVQKGKKEVTLPGYFITKLNSFSDVESSIPLQEVFDQAQLTEKAKALANGDTLKTLKFQDYKSGSEVSCPSINDLLKVADSRKTVAILNEAFQPSTRLLAVVDDVVALFRNNEDIDKGFCIQHDTEDEWDLQSLKDRGLQNDSWIYHFGSGKAPTTEVMDAVNRKVFSKEAVIERHADELPWLTHPEAGPLIDYFVCKAIPTFIGNSDSPSSILQLAVRQGRGTYWYNKNKAIKNIPLAQVWDAFLMPLVYTYTETSQSPARSLFQAAISSARKYLPKENPIHVLYHGSSDEDLIAWLNDQGVIMHSHNPKWKDDLEQMRQNGNRLGSHSFPHAGDYFARWQRIDIPLFVDSEYALVLEPDTVVKRPFTLADFGTELTPGIAMSAETDMDDTRPLNAGVTLMNIPFLRQTQDAFSKYIFDHVKDAAFDHADRSEQGAYLAFYNDSVVFLNNKFNFKPYWKADAATFEESYIIHYHGARPHDYIGHLAGRQCDASIRHMCEDQSTYGHLCGTIKFFSMAAVNHRDYCSSMFKVDTQVEFCTETLQSLNGETASCNAYCNLVKKDFKVRMLAVKAQEKADRIAAAAAKREADKIAKENAKRRLRRTQTAFSDAKSEIQMMIEDLQRLEKISDSQERSIPIIFFVLLGWFFFCPLLWKRLRQSKKKKIVYYVRRPVKPVTAVLSAYMHEN